MKRSIHKTKTVRRAVRRSRIRTRVSGTAECPRVSVFRGLKRLVVQFIDDNKAITICTASSDEAAKSKKKIEGKAGKVALAYMTGKLAAERAKEKGITKAVFDRGGYRYHGRVAAAAEGVRECGIKL